MSIAGRIEQNLSNFGILPLVFNDTEDYDRIDENDVLSLKDIPQTIRRSRLITLNNLTKKEKYIVEHRLNSRQVEMVVKGSLINIMREKLQEGRG